MKWKIYALIWQEKQRQASTTAGGACCGATAQAVRGLDDVFEAATAKVYTCGLLSLSLK